MTPIQLPEFSEPRVQQKPTGLAQWGQITRKGLTSMIAIIFEVEPHPNRKADYLSMAAELRPILEQIDGFISVERFQSLTNENKMLSLSFFRDEEALNNWRKVEEHRGAQAFGRKTAFKDYRLRVAGVIRDYGLNERAQAPEDSRALHE